MKGVILSINPQTCLIDLTHEIPPQDIPNAAFTLLAIQIVSAGTIQVAWGHPVWVHRGERSL